MFVYLYSIADEKYKITWMYCVLVACDMFASIPIFRVDPSALKKSISAN